MMTGSDFLVCPACGSRNKKSWEFCVRCGDSLEGAAAAQKGPVSEPEPQGTATGAGTSWTGILATLILLAAAAGTAVYLRRTGGDAPVLAKGALTIATVPAASKPAPPARESQGPGSADFAEGSRLLREGKPQEAAAALARAIAADSSNASYHDLYAQALDASGEREQALAEYRQAASLDPSRYRLVLARSLDRMGRLEEAQAEYEALLEANPNPSASVLRDLGNLYYRAGKYDQALSYLQTAAEANPRDLVLQQELGYAIEKSGNAGKAEEVYRGILARAPEASVTRAQLATALEKQGKGPEAIALLREGIEQNPGAASLHVGLAGALERSGRIGEAANEYREAARLAEGTPEAEVLAGRAAALDRKAGAGR